MEGQILTGPIGAGSECESVYAELICDGKHIHKASVKTLIRLFGKDRVILISDSMKATDLGDSEYMFGGQPITVKDVTALTSDGKLAGSTSTLFDCVKVAISFRFCEEVGYDADFIIVDEKFNLIRAISRREF